ncbi:uncharacterized protein LOC125682654 [Ostrea edulis]|uniref:uncharacterized protein LOC125682654 n=1 Tax=Ostrea edulis TaxID=37623 RepID=UPI0024AFACFA|nr:uncharacterized protein LOC125682654 [Ostrea edulis]
MVKMCINGKSKYYSCIRIEHLTPDPVFVSVRVFCKSFLTDYLGVFKRQIMYFVIYSLLFVLFTVYGWAERQPVVQYISGNTGRLASPGYPGPYPNNVNYTWILTTGDPTTNVTFTFDKFYIYKYQYGPCTDFLEITEQEPCCFLALKRCGDFDQLKQVVRGNVIRLTFVSDERHSAKGFSLRWKVALPKSKSTTETTTKTFYNCTTGTGEDEMSGFFPTSMSRKGTGYVLLLLLTTNGIFIIVIAFLGMKLKKSEYRRRESPYVCANIIDVSLQERRQPYCTVNTLPLQEVVTPRDGNDCSDDYIEPDVDYIEVIS